MLLKGSRIATAGVRHRRVLLTGLLAVACFFTARPAFAQTPGPTSQPFDTQSIQTVADRAGVDGSADIYTIIGNILNIAFGILGVLLLAYFIYAGFLWMTAKGDTEQVQKAQSYIRNAIIGLIIIVSSFAVSRFILDMLSGTNEGGLGGAGAVQTGLNPSGFPGAAGALGAGLLDYHVPERDARDVPRNTSIIISFKQPIDPASIINGYTEGTSTTARDLNTDAIHVYKTGQELSTTLRSADVEAYVTADRQVVYLRPKTLLGSPTTNTDYSVRLLPGDRGIKLDAGGPSVFSGTDDYLSSSDGYSWRFEVSTVVDNTPPQIVSVIPVANGEYAPNIVVQMNFDKPLNPMAASGLLRGGTGFQNIEVAASPRVGPGSSRPDGEFTLSNQFKTVEFVTNVSCGINSCGRQVFCLPFSSNIAVRIKAATLSEVPPQARLLRSGGSLFDGIVDYTGNSFDGSGDGSTQGSESDDIPGNDDYSWSFMTTSTPNLTPPRVKVVEPPVRSSDVPVDGQVYADFDSVIQTSSLSSDSVKLKTNEPVELRDTMWWTIGSAAIRADGGLAGADDRPAGSRVRVNHRTFTAAQETPGGLVSPEYAPFYTSDVQNVYQNCFNPGSSLRCVGARYCCDDVPSATACAFPLPLQPLPLRP
jgi:hypothetical protein